MQAGKQEEAPTTCMRGVELALVTDGRGRELAKQTKNAGERARRTARRKPAQLTTHASTAVQRRHIDVTNVVSTRLPLETDRVAHCPTPRHPCMRACLDGFSQRDYIPVLRDARAAGRDAAADRTTCTDHSSAQSPPTEPRPGLAQRLPRQALAWASLPRCLPRQALAQRTCPSACLGKGDQKPHLRPTEHFC